MTRLRDFIRENSRNPNAIAYAAMGIAALTLPGIAQFATGGNADYLVSLAADGGVFVLLAIGLNVVVGFAGLLDLGYAAFFAIGSCTHRTPSPHPHTPSPLPPPPPPPPVRALGWCP